MTGEAAVGDDTTDESDSEVRYYNSKRQDILQVVDVCHVVVYTRGGDVCMHDWPMLLSTNVVDHIHPSNP